MKSCYRIAKTLRPQDHDFNVDFHVPHTTCYEKK